jgi:uncharacterized protein DUF3105
VVGVLILALLGACGSDAPDKDEAAKLTSGGCRYDTKSDPGSDHVADPPPYKVNPPSGGNHTAQVASEGVYREGQVPPDGPIVHAMEHGYVVLWYRPGDQQLMSDAEDLGDRYSDVTLVIPRPSMDVPAAATAWHRRLLCPSFDEKALEEFIKAYEGKGPEKIPGGPGS